MANYMCSALVTRLKYFESSMPNWIGWLQECETTARSFGDLAENQSVFMGIDFFVEIVPSRWVVAVYGIDYCILKFWSWLYRTRTVFAYHATIVIFEFSFVQAYMERITNLCIGKDWELVLRIIIWLINFRGYFCIMVIVGFFFQLVCRDAALCSWCEAQYIRKCVYFNGSCTQ